ncbi:Gfo/Idh/MocA family protein [Luteimonas aquatica]|uniref:Gfo/Idh/MocA family protein n=1 Tax=Luteimonas aquatica TaxID=450364 RepID=UPI001F58FF07|nr:Gfo/Idh/MocA family oxidoreductase [Luteimonas aquatica]
MTSSTSTAHASTGATHGPINILLIGLGPHAQRTYVRHVDELARHDGVDVRLSGIVELEGERDRIEALLRTERLDADAVFVPPFEEELPDEVASGLDGLARRRRIDAVIISTEPLSHRAYALWALARGLSVLLDKPVTTRANAVSDAAQARLIAEDADDILAHYERAAGTRRLCLVVNSHRRWHPAFDLALSLIREVRDLTGCPVTSVSSSHCDGQWRFPSEILQMRYHPFNQGYGKISHSGYHILDAVYRFFKAGYTRETAPDRASVYSSLLQPAGFVKQIPRREYERLFGAEYVRAGLHSDAEVASRSPKLGEIDAKALIEFGAGGDLIGQAQIDLRHNGFSRRHWLWPRPDLYKAAGRVKHETHEIVCGPYQTVVLESRQASDRHERSAPADRRAGGNNHFDVKIFRNTALTGGAEPYRLYRAGDLAEFDDSRLHIEQVKKEALREFVLFVAGRIERAQLRSNIDDHLVPARLMSAIYLSHVARSGGGNPVVPLEFEAGMLVERDT